jgi:hypothetical protein
MVYFQYFNFIEVAFFCQFCYYIGKKHIFLYFFPFFFPQCSPKKKSSKKDSPIATLSTQPLGGRAVDFENFTF